MRLALVGDLTGDRYDLARLAGALVERGHDVEVITAAAPSATVAGNFDVVPIPVDTGDGGEPHRPEDLMPAISEIGRFLVDRWQREQPDLVHCHDWSYGLAAQLAAKLAPIPTVQSFHGLTGTAARHSPRPGSGSRANFEALLAKSASMVTAACTDDMLEVIRSGCPRARVSVLPPGIDVDEVSCDGTRSCGESPRRRIVSLTNDFSIRSGADRMVRALPSLPSAELTLLGRQADRQDLDRLHGIAERCGVSGRIRVAVASSAPELSAHLRTADVVVCPSPYDPQATSVLQAMASGAAVVATDTGGARDAIVADVTGILVAPGNTEALTRAVRSVLSQTVLRQGMGLAGRARVRSRYSWERIATDAEVVYRAAAQQTRGVPAR